MCNFLKLGFTIFCVCEPNNILTERLFLGFFKRGLILFFLKNNFSEIFTFAILFLCTLFNWVRYTIRRSPVHYSTGSSTLFDCVWYTIWLSPIHYSTESGTLLDWVCPMQLCLAIFWLNTFYLLRLFRQYFL